MQIFWNWCPVPPPKPILPVHNPFLLRKCNLPLPHPGQTNNPLKSFLSPQQDHKERKRKHSRRILNQSPGTASEQHGFFSSTREGKKCSDSPIRCKTKNIDLSWRALTSLVTAAGAGLLWREQGAREHWHYGSATLQRDGGPVCERQCKPVCEKEGPICAVWPLYAFPTSIKRL